MDDTTFWAFVGGMVWGMMLTAVGGLLGMRSALKKFNVTLKD